MRRHPVAIALCALFLLGVIAGLSARSSRADAQDNSPTKWTDPRVIAELLKNCRFDAMRDRPEWVSDIGVGSTHPLLCLSGRDQSCVPDPCFTDMDDRGCRAGCEKSCASCAGRCAGECTSCKARCSDDTCRAGCAEKCASCRQGCVREVDRCSSGKCATEYEQCQARERAAWKRNGCDALCVSVRSKCEKSCKGEKPDELGWCVERCVMEGKSSDRRCSLLRCRPPQER